MLQKQEHGPILELRLARPPVNALSPELVAALLEAVRTAPATGARALLLSGSDGLFSAGLDVPLLLQLDQAAMRAFWNDFTALCAALARSPLPVAAAIGGHSPAGGAVLALLCDWRVMAQTVDPAKPFRIGLNEVRVGLTVPAPLQAALRRLVGAHQAERLMVEGRMLTPDEALACGLVDALAPMADVRSQGLQWLQDLLALPPEAMAANRRLARADLAARFDDPRDWDTAAFVERWFGRETRGVLTALAEQLKGGRR